MAERIMDMRQHRQLVISFIFLISVVVFFFQKPIINWFRERQQDERAIATFKLLLGGTDKHSMGEMDPALPKNQYMPPFLLERLNWIKERKDSDRLKIYLKKDMGNAFMGADIRDGIMYIFISHLNLIRFEYAKQDDKLQRGARNIIALELSHETLHLEEHGSNHLYTRPFIDEIEEEMFIRTIVSVNGAEPLLEKGEVVSIDDITTLEILRNCDSWIKCEKFRESITNLYKNRYTERSTPLQENH